MSGARAGDTLLAERLRTVLALGEATSAHQRAQTEAGGAAIASMSADRGPGGRGSEDTGEGAREAAARARLDEAAERVRALTERLDALDGDLAAREARRNGDAR